MPTFPKRRWKWIVLTFLLLAVGGIAAGRYWLAAMQNAAFWEAAIEEFEASDRERPPEAGAILFTGSSSIRLWSSLARDMQPLRVLNRGFGGSHLAHVNHYADRIVLPYRPSAVVLYAGDNDLSEGTDKTPASVFANFERFVAIVHGSLPDARIYFLSIKPSLLRWHRWPQMREANERIAAFAAETDGVEYVDVATPMLGPSGDPRPELFALGGLHLSDQGYALWTGIVKPRLEADATAR